MIFRNQIRNLTRERIRLPVTPSEREREILALVEPARLAFRTASELDDASEYGYIALAQMCVMVIEFGYRHSESKTYGGFLARADSGIYRELLAEADESIDAAQEIRGADRPSFAAEEAELGIVKLYDDYQALLQGWRSPGPRRPVQAAYPAEAGPRVP